MSDLRPNRALRTSIEEFRGQSSNESPVTNIQVNNASANNQAPSDLKLTSSWANGLTHISIKPPEGAGARAPCDICCVVDTSGSMGTEVEIHNSNNSKEKYGLSQLDLVKHALKTIVHSLTSSDRLSIVSFANSANVLFKLRQMDDDGRSTALAALERLDDNGQTNLWDGLRTGLDILAEGQRATGSNVALFLLTDGCPNVEPPRGHLPTLAAYKDKKRFTCSINTFGFGYQMDSKLLEDLSQMGNCGSYAFIPDGSFVGTIFVNAISNLLTTAATNVQLIVGGGIQIDPSSELTRWYSSVPGSGQVSFRTSEQMIGKCFRSNLSIRIVLFISRVSMVKRHSMLQVFASIWVQSLSVKAKTFSFR
jgi:Mg-chelatase subunit ChlD